LTFSDFSVIIRGIMIENFDEKQLQKRLFLAHRLILIEKQRA